MEQAPDVWENLRSLYLSWLICGQQGMNVGQFKQYNATNHTGSWELDESDSGINKKSDQKKKFDSWTNHSEQFYGLDQIINWKYLTANKNELMNKGFWLVSELD